MSQVTNELLHTFPLFAGLGDAELTLLVKAAHVVEYKKCEEIYAEGTKSAALYLVSHGRVKITHKVKNDSDGEGTQTFGMIKEKNFFGELSLLDGRSHSATAIAATSCQIVVVNGESFDRLIEEDPASGLLIIKRIAIEIAHLLRAADRKFLDVLEQYLGFYRE